MDSEKQQMQILIKKMESQVSQINSEKNGLQKELVWLQQDHAHFKQKFEEISMQYGVLLSGH